MKHLSPFSEFLLERKQRGFLYHYTSLYGLYDILSTDFIKANNRTNCVSLTRDKLFHRHDRLGVHTKVRITLDGDALSDKYRIRPHTDFKGSKDPDGPFSFRKVENEEVVNGPIKNIKRYIVALDIIPTNVTVDDLERFDPKKFMNVPMDLHHAIGTEYTHKVKNGAWKNDEPTPAAIQAYCGYMEQTYGFPFGTLTDSQQDIRLKKPISFHFEPQEPMFASESAMVNEQRRRGLLYHNTSIQGLCGILESNRIGIVKGDIGRSGVSLTRDKLFHKLERSGVATQVRITLDGDALTNRYRVRPYADFPNAKSLATVKATRYRIDGVESEEKIKEAIMDARKYILAIDIVEANISPWNIEGLMRKIPELSQLGEFKTVSKEDDEDGCKYDMIIPGFLQKLAAFLSEKFDGVIGILPDTRK